MSKYYKAEDVLRLLSDEYYSQGKAGNLATWESIKSLPTIEVSEDCISREWVQNKLTEYVKDYELNELDSWQNTIVEWIATDIEDAPSVVPRLDKEDLEDIYEHISESYIEGYMDGQVDGVNAIGDCNLCRFAGCSECDDCLNGSQWVRMTKEDEVEE